MSPTDRSSDGNPRDPFDQLRHDLKTPLTTIHGRTQLLARAIRRSPSLADEERVRLLAGLSSIEETVRAMVTHIDGMREEGQEP